MPALEELGTKYAEFFQFPGKGTHVGVDGKSEFGFLLGHPSAAGTTSSPSRVFASKPDGMGF